MAKKHIILQCLDAMILAQQGKTCEPVEYFSVRALSPVSIKCLIEIFEN